MKNFDTEREQRAGIPLEDRQFQLGGELFVMRDGIRPEVLTRLDALRDPTTDPRVCSCDHVRQAHGPQGKTCQHPGCDCEKFDPKVIDPGASMEERLKALDDTFVAMLEPDGDSEERYRMIREREHDPILFPDLGTVIEWMVEGQTKRRPTGSRSGSTPGRESTGMTSMVSSYSPDTPAESTI